MTEIDVDLECSVCGAALKAEWIVDRYSKSAYLEVTPCAKCLENEKAEGDKDGYARRDEEKNEE